MNQEEEPQYSLFPDEFPNPTEPSPQDIAAMNAGFADQIRENSAGREVHYDDAPSDQVMEDLGLYRDVPGEETNAGSGNISPLPKRRRSFNGPIPGDDHIPITNGQPDEDHRESARINLPLARQAITEGPDPNDSANHSPTSEQPKSPEEIARIARGKIHADIIRKNWAANRKK
jgi:hypothetical protein